MTDLHGRNSRRDRGTPSSVFRANMPLTKLAVAISIVVTGCNGVQFSPQEDPAVEEEVEDWSAFNINDVFPEGAGRELVLDNCQSCHVLVPILVLPLDEAAWYRSSLEHRERVEGLTDSEFETLYQYLASNFTPDRETPKLPPALLDSWTTY